ncbi:MAG TPA: hypothetical protein VJB89_01375 [Candidatus Nanoarchaeia archaeon]|nr:hypothetical protein [Candidatus Nanoarchaeia archaeon]
MANMKKTKRNILAIAGVSGMVLGIVLIIPSFMQEKYAIAIFSAILMVTGLVLLGIAFGD